jgi:hypothetical protein
MATKPVKPTTKPTIRGSISGGFFTLSKTAKAKADYKKAVSGGAAKTAAKVYPNQTKQVTVTQAGTTSGGKQLLPKYKTVTTKNNEAKRKAATQNILNDKSKNITRAKIAEMNAKKARTKKAK